MAITDVATSETIDLIASDKVEGTAVYNHRRDRLGTIHNFMVNKRTGQVQYAVLSFGGLLGIGAEFYPLPWDKLTYDLDQGGYLVDLDRAVLDKAPRYAAGQDAPFDDAYGRQVNDYYGVEYRP